MNHKKLGKYKLGEDVKGTCPNCFGRGRKQHLEYHGEYQGDEEVVCMVCSCFIKLKVIKLNQIEWIGDCQ